MRTIPALTLALAVLVVGPVVAADDTGALQVTCRPGHRVYLDGEFIGLTAAEQDGLHLKAVAPGRHEIRVEKLGLKPRTLSVTVISGRAVEVRVPDLEPETAEEPTPAPTPAPPAAAPAKAAPAAVAAGVALAAAPVAAAAAEPPAPAPAAAAPAVAASAAQPAEAPPAAVAAPAPGVATVSGSGAVSVVPAPSPTTTGAPGTVIATTGVAFVYRAGGTALASGERSVSIFRERGGPKVPVLAFVCSAPSPGCADQTPASFAPGSYRFRVVCREAGAGRRDPDVFNQTVTVELEATAARAWEIAAVYEASPSRCQAVARPLE